MPESKVRKFISIYIVKKTMNRSFVVIEKTLCINLDQMDNMEGIDLLSPCIGDFVSIQMNK